MKFNSSILISLIALATGCHNLSQKEREFKEFTDKFPDVVNSSSTPILFLSDTMKDFWVKPQSETSLSDSLYLEKYALLKKYTDTKYPPERVTYINLKKAGKFNRDGFTLLLYSGATTAAGSGNYVMVMASFTGDGKKIDEMPVIRSQEWDFDQRPFQIFRLISDSNFTITNVTRNYGFLNKEIVPTYTAQTTTVWRIKEDGQFVQGESISEELFKDANMAIADTMPGN